jgi:dihydroorotate dehydrogenase
MLFSLARPLLHRLDPEVAHTATVRALGLLPRLKAPSFHPMLAQTLFGLAFASPVGLAAGFDKNADVPDAMLSLGFGFTEVGTITPQAQPGNPTPRIFRLREDEAVINRLGFNNKGLAAACGKLRTRKNIGIVGVNIGANKTTEDKIADYVLGIEAVRDFASYITINISSPNTPGLRALQSRSALVELVERCLSARGAHKVAMLIKIAPDLTPEDVDDIAMVALMAKIDGLIVSNTTITRPDSLRSAEKSQSGGLSGAPLFALSTQMLRDVAIATQRKIPLIGVGGVASAAQAYAKIRAGASLVQLYSGLIYHGPGLAKRIAVDLPQLLIRDGFSQLEDAIGADLPTIAKKDI